VRLAFIAPGVAPDTGGVETVVTELARALVARDVAVEVWTQQRGLRRPAVSHLDEIVVRRFPCSNSVHYPLSPQLWRHTRRSIGGLDLLHGHSYHSAVNLGVLASDCRVPFVYSPHYHGTGHTWPARALHRVYGPIGRRLVRRAARVIAVSWAEARMLQRDFPGVEPRLSVVHNGVATRSIAAAHPMPGQPPTLLSLGRLEGYKRIDAVIEAFDRVTSPGQLIVVGDGPARGRIEDLATRSRRSEDIRVLGRISDAEVARWLRTASGVVNLSEHEAFGLVALEGAAGGAAVLLSDIDAHREVANLLDGRVTLVHPYDRTVVAQAMESLLRGANNGPREDVGTWEQAADCYMEVYRSVVADRIGSDGQLTSASSA